MHALDAAAVVLLMTRENAERVAAIKEFIAERAWISHVALAEAAALLRAQNLGHREITSSLEMLTANRQLTFQDPDVINDALTQYRKAPAAGFGACLALEAARKAGYMPFGACDPALRAVSGTKAL
jgi:predicted nucleic-acid-binding protein